MSIVTLVSGGIDSTLMSIMAHEEGMSLHPLFINYGQLGAAHEWKACQYLHKAHGLPTPVRMDLSGYGRTIPSGITNRALRLNEDAFLPGRNLLFVLAGAGYAYHIHADGVAIGLLNPKYHLFADQTGEFLKECEMTIETAMGRHIAVIGPLLRFSKRDVLSMAKERGLKGTYSCHSGRDTPCGRCVSCIEIKVAKKRR